jgi:hypothetical protein
MGAISIPDNSRWLSKSSCFEPRDASVSNVDVEAKILFAESSLALK